jgi:diguanylate cyclase (GGDEF)-like protein
MYCHACPSSLCVNGRRIFMPATETTHPPHPRTLSWLGTSALAMGGSNQMVFLVGALIAAQGSGAVPILIVGLLLSWAAAPGWTELVLMWPGRVGGIAATCAEAFRPYSPVLANLTGVCYWWGWVPTCGFTAILSATALHEWYLPFIPVTPLAIGVILTFLTVNLLGVRAVARVAIPVASVAAFLALLSAVVPLISGSVDLGRAVSFHLKTPFHGAFGALTSAMAGLYLVGFAAPAFEAAACHVGETKDPARNVPRAIFASGAMAGLFFIVLPLVWLGSIGSKGMGDQLIHTIGPTFAPLFAGGAKAAAIWFMVANMFMGTMQPLAGASRTLSQLSEDGLLPRSWARRSRRDVPWVTTLLTAGLAIGALLLGVPTWMIAAANFAYLIGIGLPSLAVWLLRRNEPERPRPYRAPRGTVVLGVGAAMVWFAATALGFEQFGLRTVLLSLGMAYAGSLLYAWRRASDRRRSGTKGVKRSLQLKLTGAMIAVVGLDGAGYLLAVSSVPHNDPGLISLLQDIFVAVAMLTIGVGLVLPGMIGHAVEQVSTAAARLATGTLADLTRAMRALSIGDLDAATARVDVVEVQARTQDELGAMAASFNTMQHEVGRAAEALDGARKGLAAAEGKLEVSLRQQTAVAQLGRRALEGEDVRDLIDEAVLISSEALGRDVAATILGSAGVLRIDAGAVPMEGQQVPIGSRESPLGELRVAEIPVLAADELAFLQAIANVLADAIERLHAEEDVRHQALHDALTGLPNRVLFSDRLELAIAAARRDPAPFSVLMIDLNQFKEINDTLGHSIGDQVLCEVGPRLTPLLRPGDTLARLGGDEFMVLLPSAGSAQAREVTARILRGMREPFALGELSVTVDASVGMVTYPTHGQDAETLVQRADIAMYLAKGRGGGEAMYDAADDPYDPGRLRLIGELREAICGGKLELHYQPQFSTAGLHVVGVEALVRWPHPSRGLLAPGEFIPLAEHTGLIRPLTLEVLRQAARQWRAWHEDGIDVTVAVNLSVANLLDDQLVDDLGRILAEERMCADRLVLEITESTVMTDPGRTIAMLERLAAMNIRLSVDDYGTGHSSLAYLRRLPVHELKIDRAFVQHLAIDEQDVQIVRSTIDLGHSLGLRVVAEGVEDARSLALLQDHACDLVQGFYLGRPVPPDALLPQLRNPASRSPASTVA